MKIETRVVNLKEENYEVYIGRGNKWGNPYRVGIDGNREEVIQKYKDYIYNEPKLIDSIGELRGKVLGCFCKPKKCHGTVLLELLSQKYCDKFVDDFILMGEEYEDF